MAVDHLSRRLQPDPVDAGLGRPVRDRQRRRRRLEPLPGRQPALAARDLRAPRPRARRRPRPPHLARGRSRARRSTPTTRAPSARCACASRRGTRSRSRAGCGRRRCTRRGTPATACRWRSTSAAASTRSGATPAASSARRTRSTRTTWRAAEAAGVRVRPDRQVESVRRSTTDGYRYIVTADVMDNEGDHPTRSRSTGSAEEIECKVLVMAAGAMGTPPILMRSKQNGDLPSMSDRDRQAPRRQRRPHRRHRVRPEEDQGPAQAARLRAPSTRASRSRR